MKFLFGTDYIFRLIVLSLTPKLVANSLYVCFPLTYKFQRCSEFNRSPPVKRLPQAWHLYS